MQSSAFPFWLLWCCCSWSLGATWPLNDDTEKQGRHAPTVTPEPCRQFERPSNGTPNTVCVADCENDGAARDVLACTTRREGCICQFSKGFVLNRAYHCIQRWMCDQMYEEAHGGGDAVRRGATF
ncbi:uncharacterized protein LOC135369998 isoform X1 [Ornithodoros turicata]|uniref:uncharacterized protein LOC135369998 isoform X1 n=1 Tax=Ornithodoros turicata TaxID=34597 RepID=UPI00313A35C6